MEGCTPACCLNKAGPSAAAQQPLRLHSCPCDATSCPGREKSEPRPGGAASTRRNVAALDRLGSSLRRRPVQPREKQFTFYHATHKPTRPGPPRESVDIA